MIPIPSFSVKDILDLFKKGMELEAQEKIMEYRQAALDRQDENARLREQIHELERRLELRELTFDGLVYWWEAHDPLGEGNRPQRDGPFCPRCCDADSKRIRLHPNDNYGPSWHCYTCNNDFSPRSE